MVNQLGCIALGGALGALSRYGVASLVYHHAGRLFPYGTLCVNVLGSFFIGYILVCSTARAGDSLFWNQFVVVGMLGSFTTFSTFSMETISLIQRNQYFLALLNILLSLTLCLLATGLGVALAKRF